MERAIWRNILLYVTPPLMGDDHLEVVILSFILVRKYRRKIINKNGAFSSWPVVGMLPDLLKRLESIHDSGTEFLMQNGGTFEFEGPWLANMDFLATCDPVNVEYILAKNFANYPKGPEFRDIFEEHLGDGILNADSDSWRKQRKMFQSLILGQSKFELFVAKAMHKNIVHALIPVLDHVHETRTQVDLQEVMQRIAFIYSFSLFFGCDPFSRSNNFPEGSYQKAFGELEDALFRRYVVPKIYWKLQRQLSIGIEGRLKRIIQLFEQLFNQSILLKREEHSTRSEIRRDDDNANSDMLTSYLEDEEKEAKISGSLRPQSDKFLRDTAFNFVAAGIASVSACLAWFFWLVATHPSVETKILEEIKENLPASIDDKNSVGFVSAQELNKLVYLHAAFCETLRLYPPIPFNHKAAVEADVLPSGHRVKKNMRIMLSFYSMGRMEDLWGKDCLEFKPERWIAEQGGLVYVPSHKFIAFNTGPRLCLGKDMSLIQMKAIATAVLSNYRLQVVESHIVSPRLAVVLHMKHGLKVKVSKRSI